MEVLPRGVDVLVRTFLFSGGPVSRQLAQVSEGREQRELLAPQLGVGGRKRVSRLDVLGDQRARSLGAHVVTRDHGPERVQVLACLLLRA